MYIIHFSALEICWFFHSECTFLFLDPPSYIFDGGKLHRLVKWRLGMMGRYYELETWQQPKRQIDSLGAPVFYTGELPSLDGTELENAKLWEYAEQAYRKEVFYPVAYLRFYQRHPAVENLITAGLGRLLGQAFEEECERNSMSYSGIRMVAPKLSWMNWKECKPAKILGMNRAELRQVARQQWDLKKLRLYLTLREDTPLEDFELAVKELRLYFVERLHNAGAPLAKTVRYLKKQAERPDLLLDYWQMADHQRGGECSRPAGRGKRSCRRDQAGPAGQAGPGGSAGSGRAGSGQHHSDRA